MIPASIGPYSTHMKVGDLLFVSGQLPISPNTSNIELQTIKGQTIQALENVKSILESEGLSMSDVVKTTVLLSDINNFEAMNDVYGLAFKDPYPARSSYEVAALPKKSLIEIEVIARFK